MWHIVYLCAIQLRKMQYFGSHNLSVDEKGRIVIPVSFREHLKEHCQGSLVIGQTFRAPCISIYPAPEFDRVRDELMRNRNATLQFQNLLRIIVGTAQNCEMLATGRVLVPKQLRQFNSIERDAMLIGVGTRFELWDQGQWQAHCAGIKNEDGEDYQIILEKLPI